MSKKLILIAAILSTMFAWQAMAQSLVPKVEYPKEVNKEASKITLVKQLPLAGNTENTGWTTILSQVISLILGITGSMAMVAFTVGGIFLVMAQGDEGKITKGKNILFWSIFALLVIAASYALVLGVTELQFF